MSDQDLSSRALVEALRELASASLTVMGAVRFSNEHSIRAGAHQEFIREDAEHLARFVNAIDSAKGLVVANDTARSSTDVERPARVGQTEIQASLSLLETRTDRIAYQIDRTTDAPDAAAQSDLFLAAWLESVAALREVHTLLTALASPSLPEDGTQGVV